MTIAIMVEIRFRDEEVTLDNLGERIRSVMGKYVHDSLTPQTAQRIGKDVGVVLDRLLFNERRLPSGFWQINVEPDNEDPRLLRVAVIPRALLRYAIVTVTTCTISGQWQALGSFFDATQPAVSTFGDSPLAAMIELALVTEERHAYKS